MAEAVVGDDVYGEDPTVNELESRAAALLGKEAALFLTSGTQSNLVALLTHCQRGDEYLVAADAHCYRYEGGGGAVLGGIQPQPIEPNARGLMDLRKAEAAIKPLGDDHYVRTRLLCLENTHKGRAWPVHALDSAAELASRRQLSIHLDGARLFNASVASGVSAKRLARDADTVSVCLSKGLCAPAGSLLAGKAAVISVARRWRKTVGGGMRQSGILAAAGLVALEQQVERLAEDHATARALADGLASIEGLEIEPASVETNMVWLRFEPRAGRDLGEHLRGLGILVAADAERARLVTHQGIAEPDVARVVAGFESYYGVSAPRRHHTTATPVGVI